MPVNVEVKARVRDRGRLEAILGQLSGSGPRVLRQTDTFFTAPRGRLKLREENGQASLIAYRRADVPGPRAGTWSVTPVPDPRSVATTLATALDRAGVVRKVRHLYLVGNSRVHLDRVQGLGDFLEIEAQVELAGSPEAARDEARALLDELGVPPEDLVARAYIDMLEEVGWSEGRPEC